MANSVDPDQTPRSAASDLGLHYLRSSGCLVTFGKHDTRDYKTRLALHGNLSKSI